MNFRRALLLALCLASLAAGTAQTLPKRPGLPERIPVPRNPVPAPTVVPAPPPVAPVGTPAVRVVPQGFNLDTALAKILADAKIASGMGEFELCVTNAARVETNRFPFWIHLRDGQVRTELDISSVPAQLNATGPFVPFRQEGISRLVNLTIVNQAVRQSYQIFPEKRAYVSRDLATEDMPLLIQLQKQSTGPDTFNGQAAEQWRYTLTHPTGERRTALVWQLDGTPRQVQFHVGDSRLTIRLREVRKTDVARTREEAAQDTLIFVLPSGSEQFMDVGSMLSMLSARRVKSFR